ncbi:SCO6745 family protein [Nocardia sp. NBC_00416]|uniref:SCO6745 family protein n=1 Tax=Nocardia sp. NBC_00416 TaxID=2975991 RepID=UPI002E1B8409
MSTALPEFTRQAWRLLEPLHAVTYFSPEPLQALKSAGYRGFWMGYFAGRAAPLGAVQPEVVHALFYNFTVERVRRALPSAWEFAPPEAALTAREKGSSAALRRQFGELADNPDVATAAELASRAAAAAPTEGRALFAANRALPEPDEPVARLWHAASLLREHRGDGHVAALLATGIKGRESHVLQAMSHGTPRHIYTVSRDFDDEEWHTCLDSLRARGLIGDDGPTHAGAAVKAEIEARTDALAAPAYEVLTPGERDELVRLLRPLTHAVLAAGEIPDITPIGSDLREVPTRN